MTDTPEELRIIAQDAHLASSDRAKLKLAADEIEHLQKMLILTNAALIESQQRQIATNDQLIAVRKSAPKPVEPIWTTIYSGKVEVKGWA